MTAQTAIIADDEPHLVRYLQDALTRVWPELKIIGTAANGAEAAALIDLHVPDVAFLDIQMPALTGIDVARGIEGKTLTVFVTAYDEFAAKAFDEGAIDYLLKPVNDLRLAKCIERVRARLTTNGDDSAQLAATLRRLLNANTSGAVSAPQAPLRYLRAHERAGDAERVVQIDVNDVLYFDAADKYTCVLLATGEQLLRTAISELELSLDAGQFQRIHRSTIVNLHFVEATSRDDSGRLFVHIKNHTRKLPVSRAYHDVFARM
jgi:DNA-binding LytR/AlgR family response regulator